MKALTFATTFLNDIKVAAVAPTSRYAIARMLPYIPVTAQTVVEYGPGDGVITKHLLRRMPQSGKLIAVERNPDFVLELMTIRDRRLCVKEGDALHINEYLRKAGIKKIDAAISGIPFSFFKPKERLRIVEQTYEALAPNGVFVVYQFSRLMLPYLREYFANVEWHFEPRNLPPLFFIMVAKKSA